MDSKGVEDIMALTPMQEGMLFHYLKDPGSDYYFEQLCLSISGEIDLDCFKGAWDVVVETNEMLRTRFSWEKLNEPVQVVLKKHSPRFSFYDFSGDGDKGRLLEKVKSGDRKETFDLNDVPSRITLCKTGTGKYEMIISNHHILYDGWSNGIILKELFSSYHDLLRQKEPAKPQKHKYREYIKWMQTREKEKQEKYWRGYLDGFEAGMELSIKRKKKKGENKRTGNDHYKVNILKAERAKLDTFIKTRKITLACLFYSAWGILLQKYNNSGDVIFGTVISGRPAGVKGIEDIVGLFINTVPLRVKIKNNGCEKTADLLQGINKELQEREEYEAASLVEIREYSRLGVEGELFDNIVVIENYPLENVLSEGEGGGLSVDSYWIFEKTHYDLTLGITLFDEIEVDFHFERDLFDVSGINRLARHFMNTVWEIINNPGRAVRELDILTEEEKNKILYGFNKTKAKYPQGKTIHGIFADQAEKNPFHTAVIFIDKQLTYRELNKRSDVTAHELKSRGVRPGSIVGIMAGRSLEMLIGIMGILKAGGAYLPLDPGYPPGRIDYMLKDSGAKILLTNLPEGHLIHHSSFITHHSGNLAYIIYTSGTTGKPKGVMVDHSAVLNRLYWVKERYGLNERDVILQATSFIFDVSVCEMFRWIPAGGKLCFLPPGGEKDPGQIVETMTRYGVTTADFVPSMLSLILDHVDRQKIYKELSGLRWVFTGVEVVGLNLVKRFDETLNKVNRTTLINAYGPTESTVDVTYFDCSNIRGDNNDVVPIGKPMANVRVYILDGHGGIRPIGVYGELCIAGKGLARGYLNHPELTNEKFLQGGPGGAVFSKSAPPGRRRLYRTGDLARWLADGNIEFLGRMDHQVKIRGFRVELGEIESHLLGHEKIKDAVVTAGDRDDGEKYLCAYIVSGEKIEISELKNKLAVELPGYMIPVYIVQLDRIPLTAGGNVDRRALPGPGSGIMGDEYTAPVNLLEEELVSIWSEVLNLEKEAIGTSHNFFQLGGHSLKATILISRIHKKLDIKVPLQEIFNFPTIKGLCGYIGTAAGDKYVSIEAAEEREYYRLSSAQKRLYILQQMEEKRTSYNMFHAVVLKGEVSGEIFAEIFRKLIRRHESLRTSFEMVGSEPVQRIHEKAEFLVEYYLATEDTEATEKEEKKRRIHHSSFIIHHLVGQFIRPFDLSRAPLLRAGLIEMNGEEYLLMLDMHHIVSDGTSVEIFINEFSDLYSGSRLPGVKLRYKDFSQWQGKRFASGGIKSQEDYWLKQFEVGVPLLNLPFDYERPPVQVFDFDRVDFEAGRELAGKIRELVMETGVTLYMVLLAAYYILLSTYGGQEDIIVGTGVVGRTHPDTEHIMGMFVNMLALRSRPAGNKTLAGFLGEVRNSVLAAFENQDYPFDELVKRLNLRREYGRNPLFDTEFTFHDEAAASIEIPGLVVEPYEYESSLLKFDLSLTAFEVGERIHLTLGFSPRLFKRGTIENMAGHFIEIMEQLPGNKNRELKDIGITIDHRLHAAGKTFSQGDYTGFEF